jgi:hypothetical protein
MPKYRFLIENGSEFEPSDLVELSGIQEAKSKAVIFAGDMLREIDGAFWPGGSWRLAVADEQGLIQFTIEVHGFESPALKGQTPTRPTS